MTCTTTTEWSRRYRDQFIDGPLFDGLDLRGRACSRRCAAAADHARVAGPRCTGHRARHLARRASIRFAAVGRIAAAPARRSPTPACQSEAFDARGRSSAGCTICNPTSTPAIDEIHRLLKPGGSFSFFEPHTGSLPDLFRQQWYKRDALFEDNEAAIDLERLKRAYARANSISCAKRTAAMSASCWSSTRSSSASRCASSRSIVPPSFASRRLLQRLQGRRLACTSSVSGGRR